MKPAEASMVDSDGAGGSAGRRAESAPSVPTEPEPSTEAVEPGVHPDRPEPCVENGADARGPGVRRQGIKVTVAAAVSSFFGALYVAYGDGLFLAGASTALALIAYWIAEHELGPGATGGR